MREEIYQAWKKHRAENNVPEGFADRVMAQVEERAQQRRSVAAWMVMAVWSRLGRVSVCLLAGFIGLARLTQVVGVFIP